MKKLFIFLFIILLTSCASLEEKVIESENDIEIYYRGDKVPSELRGYSGASLFIEANRYLFYKPIGTGFTFVTCKIDENNTFKEIIVNDESAANNNEPLLGGFVIVDILRVY